MFKAILAIHLSIKNNYYNNFSQNKCAVDAVQNYEVQQLQRKLVAIGIPQYLKNLFASFLHSNSLI
ncbi:hypothetical protein CI593_03885 [Fischerella thermalis CCMEE 5194]|nr:hypothetical protein CI593_03885 [Fischerella thermalis CCMEE 5194]